MNRHLYRLWATLALTVGLNTVVVAAPPTESALCGMLVGQGADRLGEWSDSAFEVRDQASILWYPAHGTYRRATLRVVTEPDRWPYVTVIIHRTTYLLTQESNGEAGLRTIPPGFTTPELPFYARWAMRWFHEHPEDWLPPTSESLRVVAGSACPVELQQSVIPHKDVL